ncbi:MULTISPECIES: uridine kinase [unclassified Isoptericola]|uniref:uridine kinase family protein n=1 Tax=unclassified Isoptericola TaxID=2623355 RepID=UPI002713B04E|nr:MULTISPECIES: (d)CMP kinase [unclassified Isoptericola]MDO8144721.1 (d)CMP kinase [Isoptericola sp. 178]MDO8148572.1 (d)CMP kinase [Isoptericola sp. b515]
MTVTPDVLAVLVHRVHAAAPRVPGPGAPTAWRRTRLVCVDGPAGSGKSTLAVQLAVELDAQVVHMDDLYEGWQDGPDGGARRLADLVLAPLAAGRPGEYRRYDWIEGTWAESHTVPPAPVLVIEGCGAAARGVDPWAALRVWVEADDDERLRRGLERDGEGQRGHWVRWMRDEAAHYAAEQTRERADVRLDGVGRLRGPARAKEAS